MTTTDPRVDAYIQDAAAFAQPILTKLRAAVHAACPAVSETIKWRMPFFELQGRPLCHMAAFKQHAAFGFWRAAERGLAEASPKAGEAMGVFGRLLSVRDLPSDRELARLIARAASFCEAAPVKQPRR